MMKTRVLLRSFLAISLALPWVGCESGPSSLTDLARGSLSQLDGEIELTGLRSQVEVSRDEWGVPHIFAENMDDLFFAQGFVQAQDRLWQMEHFRRLASGRYSEIVGPSALEHDRLVRLLRYRGPFDDREWTSYHPQAKRIMTAFASGVSAFIEHRSGNLPVEFKLTGIEPEPWRAEDILLRYRVGRAVRSAREELELAMAVAELGVEEANRRANPDPWVELRLPDGLDVSIIDQAVIDGLGGDLYGSFPEPELQPPYRTLPEAFGLPNLGAVERSPGSNNWAIRGGLTASGKSLVVDDPHRQVTLPPHRYIVHLNAPEWNVIGATEPGLPGVFRGHNGRIAWGRTDAGVDQADVFVEELNPDNPMEVRYRGGWEPLETEVVSIRVKGEEPREVELRSSRHGPIFYDDHENNRAYALRSYLQIPGTAEYLGGLRLDQARSAEECLSIADYVIMPPTNIVCGDSDGNVSWRVASFAPNRVGGWYGRLPVPGTGEYEWVGAREDLPSEYNPERGWIATANNNNQPPGYHPPIAIRTKRRYRRFERIAELLSTGSDLTVEDMKTILRDVKQSEAVENQPLFQGWTGQSEEMERARKLIVDWDCNMSKESSAAALYWTWRNEVDLEALQEASGGDQTALVRAALAKAVESLGETLGPDWSEWRWGRIQRSEFHHPFVSAFDAPAVERNGGAGTVASTGAVYRLITDFSNLDGSMVTFGPGESGQPESPFYRNLLETWANEQFLPLLYTREAIEANTAHRLVLSPAAK
jgi:penicillin amidase